MESPHQQLLAGFTGCVRPLEHDLKRFDDWSRKGVFERIFEAVSNDPDMEYAMIDADRSSPSSRTRRERATQNQAIEKSKGGWTTKILALTDALGNLVRFQLLPCQRYVTIGVAHLIDGIDFDTILANKSFDANWFIEEMNKRGTKIVISQCPKRKYPIAIDGKSINGGT